MKKNLPKMNCILLSPLKSKLLFNNIFQDPLRGGFFYLKKIKQPQF